MLIPHLNCRSLGKFECAYDEGVYDVTMEGFGDDGGDVQSTAGWWSTFDLDIDCEGHEPGPYQPAGESVYCDGSCTHDWRAYRHYSGAFLLARQNDSGAFWVETYVTEAQRKERTDQLERYHYSWLEGTEDVQQ
jgi:hypothetical protein